MTMTAAMDNVSSHQSRRMIMYQLSCPHAWVAKEEVYLPATDTDLLDTRDSEGSILDSPELEISRWLSEDVCLLINGDVAIDWPSDSRSCSGIYG